MSERGDFDCNRYDGELFGDDVVGIISDAITSTRVERKEDEIPLVARVYIDVFNRVSSGRFLLEDDPENDTFNGLRRFLRLANSFELDEELLRRRVFMEEDAGRLDLREIQAQIEQQLRYCEDPGTYSVFGTPMGLDFILKQGKRLGFFSLPQPLDYE